MSNQTSPQNTNAIKLVLITTGFAFLCVSALLLNSPETILNHIDLGDENTQIFGIAAALIGASDIIIALFVFRRRETR